MDMKTKKITYLEDNRIKVKADALEDKDTPDSIKTSKPIVKHEFHNLYFSGYKSILLHEHNVAVQSSLASKASENKFLGLFGFDKTKPESTPKRKSIMSTLGFTGGNEVKSKTNKAASESDLKVPGFAGMTAGLEAQKQSRLKTIASVFKRGSTKEVRSSNLGRNSLTSSKFGLVSKEDHISTVLFSNKRNMSGKASRKQTETRIAGLKPIVVTKNRNLVKLIKKLRNEPYQEGVTEETIKRIIRPKRGLIEFYNLIARKIV